MDGDAGLLPETPARANGGPGVRLPDKPDVPFRLQAAGDKLCERVHIIIVRARGEDAALVNEVVDPRTLGEEPPVRARVREPDVARFDAGRRGLGARVLPAFGRHADESRDLAAEDVDDGRPVRRVFNQDRLRQRIPLA